MDGLVEIGLTEGIMEAEHLDSEVFDRDELVVIVPRKHPLLARKGVTAREVCREPFILREEGSGTRAVIEQALRKRGLAVTPVLSLASPEAIKRAVIAGLGIAIISRLAVDAELQAGTLALLPVKDMVVHRPLHLQKMRGKTQSPATVAFLEILASRGGRPACAR